MESGHEQSHAELAEALEAISVDAPHPAKDYAVAMDGPVDAFNAQSAGGVRPQHAIEAARTPDDVALYAYQDARLFIATKAISVRGGDFVLLVLGNEQARKRSVGAAYRLYGEASEIKRLAADATAAFQTFLEQFAIPYETKGRKVLFVPVVTGNIPAGQQPDMGSIARVLGIKWRPGERPEKPFNLHLSLRFSDSGEVTLTWPFVLDTTAYEQELARHQR